MPGRIRSIKPELMEDEQVADLSHAGFRLFIGMLLAADDYGNFRLSYRLFLPVFGNSPEPREDFAKLIETLARLSLVSRYTVRGQLYGHISGWEKHQKVDHPGKPRVPRNDDKEAQEYSLSAELSRDSREDFAKPGEDFAPDPIRSDPIRSDPIRSDPKIYTLSSENSDSKGPDKATEIAKRVVEKLNQLTGHHFRAKGKTLASIRARLKDSTEQDLLLVVEFKCAEWTANPKMQKYLTPETLFNGHFESYLGQAKSWKPTTNGHSLEEHRCAIEAEECAREEQARRAQAAREAGQ